MSELQNAYPASLEEVLVAVKETARGRWFLENYEARLRGQDNARILEAINKLENHVLSVAKSTPDGDLVKRASRSLDNRRVGRRGAVDDRGCGRHWRDRGVEIGGGCLCHRDGLRGGDVDRADDFHGFRR